MNFRYFSAVFFLATSTNFIFAQNEKSKPDSLAVKSAAYFLNRAQLQKLPFRGDVQDYYGLFPGTVVQDYKGTDYLHIRGSSHDEIGYVFEGVDVRNAFTGQNLLRFIPEALESIELETTPGAGEGNAAAILFHNLRTGGSDLKFTLRGESDRFTPEFNKRLGTYSYGYSDFVLTAEGKIGEDNIRFFVAGEREAFSDHYRKFWDGFRFSKPDALEQWSNKTLYELLGTDEIDVQPGNIPEAGSRRYTLNSAISADLGAVDLRLTGLYNWHRKQINNTPIQNIFNPKRIPESKQQASLISLQMDYWHKWLGDIRLQIDHQTSSEKTYDPLFEDDFTLYRDSLAVEKKGVNFAIDPDIFFDSRFDPSLQGPGTITYIEFPFSMPGQVLTDYGRWQDNRLGVAGEIKKKMGKHMLTLGGQWEKRTVRRFRVNTLLSYMQEKRENERSPEPLSNEDLQLALRERGDIEAYGYDVFGNKVNNNMEAADAPARPQTNTVYISDQVKTGNVLLNFGLRYDRFALDGLTLNHEKTGLIVLEPAFYLPLAATKKIPGQSVFSPRFQIIAEANDKLQMQLDVGAYAQMPQLRQVYVERMYWAKIIRFGGIGLLPRALDPEPVKTKQATFRITYQPTSSFYLSAAIFNKNTNGRLHVDSLQRNQSEAEGLMLRNSGESVANGLETDVAFARNRFKARLNYTWSAVRGFQSYPMSNYSDYYFNNTQNANSTTGRYETLEMQQEHAGMIMLGYSFSANESGWLRNTGVSALFRFNSGHPYKLRDPGDFLGGARLSQGRLLGWEFDYRQVLAVETTPWMRWLDIKVERTFTAGKVPAKLYFYVQNVLNHKNVRHVYVHTGTTENDGTYTPRLTRALSRYVDDAYFDLYDIINIGHRQHYAISRGGDLFAHPREIRFGLEVAFINPAQFFRTRPEP